MEDNQHTVPEPERDEGGVPNKGQPEWDVRD